MTRPGVSTITLLAALLVPCAAAADREADPSQLLERCLAALGGEPALAAVEQAEVRYSGHKVARGQSTPQPPYASVPVSGRFVLGGRDRVRFEQASLAEGGTDRSFHQVVDAEGGWHHWLARSQLSRLTANDLRFLRGRADLYPPRALPHTYVRWALEAGSDLRPLDGAPGSPTAGLSFTDPAGRPVALSLDPATSLPVRAAWPATDLLLGTTTTAVHFSDWIESAGITVPTTLSFSTGGEENGRWRLDWRAIGRPAPLDAFAMPAGVEPIHYLPSFQPRAVADGVWAVRLFSGPANTYNTMLVDLGDSLAVVDAPLVDLFQPVVAKVASAVAPGKPIRYVIPTHHHFDHIGGIGAYFDQGVTAVATPSTASVLERLWRAHQTSAPTASSSAASIEVYERHRVLGSGERQVHLYDIGPSPHVDELVLVYVPAQRVLYVADAFAIPDSGVAALPTDAIRHFAAALERLELEVETIVPAHGLVGTPRDLARSLGRTSQ